MKNKTLYFGDNLEILREKIPDETFDLIYLDPPFNSNRSYNVIFKEGLEDSPAQIHAFKDSWHWTHETQDIFERLVGVRSSKVKINQNIVNLMLSMEKLLGHNDVLAYITMMAIRLIELKRVLKSTGSIYLHCDPTASHYLKIVMDTIFDKKNFRNEIVWRRTFAHNDPQRFGRNDDRILFYTKTDKYIFNPIYIKYNESYIENFFRLEDKGGKYQLVVLTGPNINQKDCTWKGYNPAQSGRSWSVPKRIVSKLVGKEKAKKMSTLEKLDLLQKHNYIVISKNGIPRFKQYLNEMEGAPAQEIWDDISVISANSKERLGYPTQKPEALLERIIKASSNDDAWILDPFCGCGTTVSVAERLNRNWVGIDITILAINLVKRRLTKQFKGHGKDLDICIDGIPKDIAGAKSLFKKDPFDLEYWALDLVSAVPAQNKTKENMRGADKGIDGIINFVKDKKNNNYIYGKILVQVKGGAVHRNQIATLKGDVERERADGGLFITLEKPTKPMVEESIEAGSYKVIFSDKKYPKIQILTIADLLDDKKVDVPPSIPYHKEAVTLEIINKSQTLL